MTENSINLNRNIYYLFVNLFKVYSILSLTLFLAGCATVKLVQPYDADLYNNTEAFYKKASDMINRGVSVSPKKPDDVRAINDDEKEQHPGHYKQFSTDYDALLIDSNALILRAMANSSQIDSIGQELQAKIETVITEKFPSECDSLQESFPNVSLTTRNYIDLKCIIGSWDKSHQGLDPNRDITYGKQILKQSNWEGRSKTLFEGILAIQQAEASKKEE